MSVTEPAPHSLFLGALFDKTGGSASSAGLVISRRFSVAIMSLMSPARQDSGYVADEEDNPCDSLGHLRTSSAARGHDTIRMRHETGCD